MIGILMTQMMHKNTPITHKILCVIQTNGGSLCTCCMLKYAVNSAVNAAISLGLGPISAIFTGPCLISSIKLFKNTPAKSD